MNEWTETLITFAAGVVTGVVLLYLLLPARRQYGKLIRERDEARKAMLNYRQQVDHHFLRTAELVNNMTESYRKVHEHLSEGARDLCSESGRRLAAQASLDALPDSKTGDREANEELEPPLDYAPSAKGTLSEDYGLKHGEESPFAPVSDLDPEAEKPEAVEPPRDYAASGDAQVEPGDEKPA